MGTGQARKGVAMEEGPVEGREEGAARWPFGNMAGLKTSGLYRLLSRGKQLGAGWPWKMLHDIHGRDSSSYNLRASLLDSQP